MISSYIKLHNSRHNISVHFITEEKARKIPISLTLNTGLF